jgi:hypothetical protein
VTDTDPEDGLGTSAEDEEAILKAKYLDYCSAQLADLLLYLSPDEIYLVAEKAARAQGEQSTGSYMKMVQTATTWLSSRVSLPPFEAWAKDYRADPDRYDRYLMGLWRSELKTDPDP